MSSKVLEFKFDEGQEVFMLINNNEIIKGIIDHAHVDFCKRDPLDEEDAKRPYPEINYRVTLNHPQVDKDYIQQGQKPPAVTKREEDLWATEGDLFEHLRTKMEDTYGVKTA